MSVFLLRVDACRHATCLAFSVNLSVLISLVILLNPARLATGLPGVFLSRLPDYSIKMKTIPTSPIGICFVAGLLFASNAFAQCATGIDTGGGNCIPPDAAGMPGYNEGGNYPQPPKAVWVDTWGAISIDSDSGKAGTVTDFDSKSAAAETAMHDCRARGGKRCQLVLTYNNQCAAVGWASDGYGVASGADVAVAEKSALSECRKAARSECRVVYSACSLARRVK